MYIKYGADSDDGLGDLLSFTWDPGLGLGIVALADVDAVSFKIGASSWMKNAMARGSARRRGRYRTITALEALKESRDGVEAVANVSKGRRFLQQVGKGTG